MCNDQAKEGLIFLKVFSILIGLVIVLYDPIPIFLKIVIVYGVVFGIFNIFMKDQLLKKLLLSLCVLVILFLLVFTLGCSPEYKCTDDELCVTIANISDDNLSNKFYSLFFPSKRPQNLVYKELYTKKNDLSIKTIEKFNKRIKSPDEANQYLNDSKTCILYWGGSENINDPQQIFNLNVTFNRSVITTCIDTIRILSNDQITSKYYENLSTVYVGETNYFQENLLAVDINRGWNNTCRMPDSAIDINEALLTWPIFWVKAIKGLKDQKDTEAFKFNKTAMQNLDNYIKNNQADENINKFQTLMFQTLFYSYILTKNNSPNIGENDDYIHEYEEIVKEFDIHNFGSEEKGAIEALRIYIIMIFGRQKTIQERIKIDFKRKQINIYDITGKIKIYSVETTDREVITNLSNIDLSNIANNRGIAEIIETVSRVMPNYKNNTLSIAQKDSIEKAYIKGREYFDFALSQNPKNNMALINIAALYLLKNRLPDAEANYSTVLTQSLDSPLEQMFSQATAHYGLGEIEFKRCNYEKAIIEYKNVIKLNSSYSIAYDRIAECYLNVGSKSQAIEWLRKLADLYANKRLYEKSGIVSNRISLLQN